MRPLTDTCPKPLLEAGGKPLIAHHLERLRRHGFKEVVINHAHLGARIETRLGDGSAFGLHIAYSPENTALETAGGIRKALPLLGEAPFIVINGDIFCDIDFGALREHSDELLRARDLAHLILVPNPPQHPAGDFVLEGGRVRNHGTNKLTFSGVGLYDPAMFAHLPTDTRQALAPLLRDAIDKGLVGGSRHDGEWQDIGTPARLAELDRRLTRPGH